MEKAVLSPVLEALWTPQAARVKRNVKEIAAAVRQRRFSMSISSCYYELILGVCIICVYDGYV